MVTSQTLSRQGRRNATSLYLFLQLRSESAGDEVEVIKLHNRIISPSLHVSFQSTDSKDYSYDLDCNVSL